MLIANPAIFVHVIDDVGSTGERYEAILKAYGQPIPKGPLTETRKDALRVFCGLPA